MHNKIYANIKRVMMPYMTKGKKSSYKIKQIKRLIAILEDIFQHEDTKNLESIGRKQIIGYWRRIENEKQETRRAKYNILKIFFALYNPKVTVPEPKVIEIID